MPPTAEIINLKNKRGEKLYNNAGGRLILERPGKLIENWLLGFLQGNGDKIEWCILHMFDRCFETKKKEVRLIHELLLALNDHDPDVKIMIVTLKRRYGALVKNILKAGKKGRIRTVEFGRGFHVPKKAFIIKERLLRRSKYYGKRNKEK